MPISERPDMAAYGVPEDPEGLLPWSWAGDRLEASRNFWVTTVDADGRPHSMPVWGWWDATSERFWFSCAPGARKARNLAANPRIVVAADDTVEVVSVEGTAASVDGEDEAAMAAGLAWATKYESETEASIAEMAAFFTGGRVFRVTPSRAFGLIERPEEFGPRATRWVWS